MNVNKIKMNAIYRKQTFTNSSCFDFHNPISAIYFLQETVQFLSCQAHKGRFNSFRCVYSD